MDRMISGDLVPFLNHLKTEPNKLRLEVRQSGKAFVYYKKCKILDLGLNSYKIEKKYFQNNSIPWIIKDAVINHPDQYFHNTCSVVENWLHKHQKGEFETQQKIATENQGLKDRYLIIDMEYNFSQSNLTKTNRVKKAGFDLLGIERETGKVIFFEVKKGLKALQNKSGIKTHIVDFEECLYGKNKDHFRENLLTDIKNIVNDKQILGLVNINLPILSHEEIELIFVFEPFDCNKNDYFKIFDEEYKKSGSKRQYKTIFLSPNNCKLL